MLQCKSPYSLILRRYLNYAIIHTVEGYKIVKNLNNENKITPGTLVSLKN
jgi:hypothetical protein